MKIVLAIVGLAIVAAIIPTTDCSNRTQTECDYITQVNAGMID